MSYNGTQKKKKLNLVLEIARGGSESSCERGGWGMNELCRAFGGGKWTFFSLNKGRILGVRHRHYRRDADRGEEER